MDYQPANYNRAVQYRHSRSYMRKLPSGHYVLFYLSLEITHYFWKHRTTQRFRTWPIFLHRIFQKNDMAFLHHDARSSHHNLYQLARFRYGRLCLFLLNLSHQSHSWQLYLKPTDLIRRLHCHNRPSSKLPHFLDFLLDLERSLPHYNIGRLIRQFLSSTLKILSRDSRSLIRLHQRRWTQNLFLILRTSLRSITHPSLQKQTFILLRTWWTLIRNKIRITINRPKQWRRSSTSARTQTVEIKIK